jgi:hypothetical protein
MCRHFLQTRTILQAVMKSTSSRWIGLLSLFALLVASGPACVLPPPIVRGPDGRPIFRGEYLIHPRPGPYFCFDAITARSNQVSRCQGTEDTCIARLQTGEDYGQRPLSACRPTSTIYCTQGFSDNWDCAETLAACEAERARRVQEFASGQDLGYATCTEVDESKVFPPPA